MNVPCPVCGEPVDPKLAAAGFVTHVNCDPREVSAKWPPETAGDPATLPRRRVDSKRQQGKAGAAMAGRYFTQEQFEEWFAASGLPDTCDDEDALRAGARIWAEAREAERASLPGYGNQEMGS